MKSTHPTATSSGAARSPRPTIPFKVAQTFCRIVSSVGFDMKVWGERNVPPAGGVLLVSNHQSYLDPVLIGIRVHRPISYLAKSELFEAHAVFSWLIRSLGAFPVRQGAGDVGAVKQTIQRLHEGHALNIYPEGSRTETGEIGPMEKGVALVIRRAKVPVVPVAIHGSFEAWPKGQKRPRFHPVRLLYGPPRRLDHLRPDEILEHLDHTLRRMYGELRARRG